VATSRSGSSPLAGTKVARKKEAPFGALFLSWAANKGHPHITVPSLPGAAEIRGMAID